MSHRSRVRAPQGVCASILTLCPSFSRSAKTEKKNIMGIKIKESDRERERERESERETHTDREREREREREKERDGKKGVWGGGQGSMNMQWCRNMQLRR